MRMLNADIHRPAAATGAVVTRTGFFLVAFGPLAAFGFGGGIDGALEQGRGGLSLHLGHGLSGGVWGQKSRSWQRRLRRRDLHGSSKALVTIINQLLRPRYEEIINHFGVNFRDIGANFDDSKGLKKGFLGIFSGGCSHD